MPAPSTKISRQEAKQALLRSGYLLESRAEATLRDAGYYVDANASYRDPLTDKSREFDLFALSALRVGGPNELDFVFPILIIECINNPQPVVLLTKEPILANIHRHEVKVSGLPMKFPAPQDPDQLIGFTEFLGVEKFHHYCQGRIATQFCSFAKKKGAGAEWMATHEEDHFASFRKLSDAVDYFQDRHYKGWVFNNEEHVNIQLYYPALVLQGELWDARATRRSVTFRRTPHLQFRRSVVTLGKEIDYQFDVMEERFLPRYLEIVDAEVTKIARLLRRRHEVVKQAADKIVAAAKLSTTPEEVRQALEY